MHPTSLAVTLAAGAASPLAPVAPALTLAGDTRSVRLPTEVCHTMTCSSKTGRDPLSTKILTDEEVSRTVRIITQAMGPEFIEQVEDVGIGVEHSIRVSALAHRFSEVREELGVTVKAAATQLKCPQYRLKDIEEGRIRHIQSAVLKIYMVFLELDVWGALWVSANPKVASKLGLRASRDSDSE